MSESIILACPHCNQLNKMLTSKLADKGKDKGKCGSCKKSLFTNSPINLNQESFAKHVVKSELPILIDFWASWCGPCKAMAPVLDEASQTLATKIRVAKINTENEQTLAAQFNIRSIPTLVLLNKGKEIERMAGAVPLAQLTQWVNNALNKL